MTNQLKEVCATVTKPRKDSFLDDSENNSNNAVIYVIIL